MKIQKEDLAELILSKLYADLFIDLFKQQEKIMSLDEGTWDKEKHNELKDVYEKALQLAQCPSLDKRLLWDKQFVSELKDTLFCTLSLLKYLSETGDKTYCRKVSTIHIYVNNCYEQVLNAFDFIKKYSK